jgi:hypothetical protein
MTEREHPIIRQLLGTAIDGGWLLHDIEIASAHGANFLAIKEILQSISTLGCLLTGGVERGKDLDNFQHFINNYMEQPYPTLTTALWELCRNPMTHAYYPDIKIRVVDDPRLHLASLDGILHLSTRTFSQDFTMAVQSLRRQAKDSPEMAQTILNNLDALHQKTTKKTPYSKALYELTTRAAVALEKESMRTWLSTAKTSAQPTSSKVPDQTIN